jgi:oxygen-independent coproporphyrinogen-3 oxidase
MTRYHAALTQEIKTQMATKQPHHLDTIFFGGGTPSTYPDDLLLDMFDTLSKSFTFDERSEVSIEVNPGTVRSEQLPFWKSLGINRLSIGVQSIKDTVLKDLNRHQKATDVTTLLDEARHYFTALSVDLILGLPGVSPDEWKELIELVVQWPINHVSVYFLTVHEDTPLYFKVKDKKVAIPCDDETVSLYYWTCQKLAAHGLEQYELSNFARRGFESHHNQAYWKRKPYYGFGLGACAFDGAHRMQNEKNLMKYMAGVERGESVVTFSEQLTDSQVRLESIMLGLRHRDGISFETLSYSLERQQIDHLVQSIAQLRADGFIQESEGAFRLTPRGLVVENDIIARLSL